MKVKVEYTVEWTREDRARLAVTLGHWPTRDDMKDWLEKWGQEGMDDLEGIGDRSVAELCNMGIPADIIVEVLS